eukprot:jgi/Mesen1/7490/ME000039S06713
MAEPVAETSALKEDLPLITVFGVTGAQGGSVARALIGSGQYRVRGCTRDPSLAKARALQEELQGQVQLVKAAQENYQELLDAFQGAYGAFIVTDFYTAGEREQELAERSVRAAREAGVQHCVWSTLADCRLKSAGKYDVDGLVRELGFRHHTFVVTAFYFQNFASAFGLTHAEAATGAAAAGQGAGEGKGERDEEGGSVVVFEVPMEARHVMQAFDVRDTGAAVLAAFRSPEAWQEEEYMNLCGFHGSMQTYLDVFSKVTGRRARLSTLSAEQSDAKYGKHWTQAREADTCTRRATARARVRCMCEQMFGWFNEYTCFYDLDVTNGRRANPGLKNWAEWLRESGWKGP